jgi:Secretion system C-terminal sorting domain
MKKERNRREHVVEGVKAKYKQWLIGGAALFWLGSAPSMAQTSMTCGGVFDPPPTLAPNCLMGTTDWLNTYRQQNSYVPGAGVNNVVKTIKIAIHIWQKDDGTGNFPQTAATITGFTQAATDLGGGMWTFNDPPTDPILGTPFIADPGLRTELMGIYFHQNTTVWGYNCGQGGLATQAAITANPEVEKAINLHVLNPTCCAIYNASGAASGGGGVGQFSSNAWVATNGELGVVNSWVWAQHWAHEIGHNLGLCHTYGANCGETLQFTALDFLSDVFGTTVPVGCVAPPGSLCFHGGGWNCDPNAVGNTCTNNMMGSTNASGYYSPRQMGRMHRALATYNARKYAWGYSTTPYTLATDQTWDFNIKFYQDIVVPTGRTLTIKCTVEMVPQAKIVVQPGARLIIDGGKVTLAQFSPSGFWGGIQAWGTTAQHQYGSPIPQYHALVELKNGAVIEHAREGIQTMNPLNWAAIGGIVKVQGTASQVGATFLNCRRAVSYVAYQNFNPANSAQKRPNLSYFNYCDFIVDDNYHGVNDFYAHVSMWRVDGIKFRACNFKNLQTTITQSDKLGQGILSLDANYTVSGSCTILQPCCLICPEVNLRRSTFIGLDHGIEASVAETDRNFVVTTSSFMNNVVGVFNHNVNCFEATRSNFVGGGRNVTLTGTMDPNLFLDDATTQADAHRGIYSEGGHGFRIEENHVEGVTPLLAGKQFVGIWINHSGANNDQVYKNDALNCWYGFIGERQCFDPASGGAVTGLQFLCNTNYNPETYHGHDIWDKKKVGAGDDVHSIRTQQGMVNKPAEGSFSHELFPANASDYRNSTTWNLNYWFNLNNTNAQPQDLTLGWVGTAPTTSTNACPSNFVAGHLEHPNAVAYLTAIRQQFANAKAAYTPAWTSYNTLLDAGNTATLTTQVQATTTAATLYALVNPKAPWLSESVLRAVVTKNLLTKPQLMTVLLGNPDATKQNGFVDWIQTAAAAGPILTAAELTQVRNSWTTVTARTTNERTLGEQHASMSWAGHTLIQEFKSDSTGDRNDSTLVRWQQMPNLGARYSECLTRLQRSEYNQATALITGLNAAYKLTSADLTERQDALDYITAVKTIRQAGRNMQQLTAADKTSIRAIANRGCTRPAQWAQNILCFGYGECWAPCTGGAATTRSMEQVPPEASIVEVGTSLVLYPNPTNAQVTVQYTLAGAAQNAMLVLYNVDGREVKRLSLASQAQQVNLDLHDLAAGSYSVVLQNAGKLAGVQRMVVTP